MSQKRKPALPIREGKPSSCIVCHGTLHRKSEHYCSTQCESVYKATHESETRPFLSKWKLRKIKALRDPLLEIRQKTRRKTKIMVKAGILRRGPCAVCGGSEVIAHHENYERPRDVIWLCDMHHKEYHAGKIGLFDNKLWWNPSRLIPRHMKQHSQSKKYRTIKKNFNRQKRRRGEQGIQQAGSDISNH